jgi:hypothetical protein
MKMRKEYFAIITASIVVTLALDFFIDSLKTKEITTNALYLKNQTGKICAEFSVSPEGDPELLLRGGERNHGMQLSLTQGTPSIFLYDDQTKTRAGLALLSLATMREDVELCLLIILLKDQMWGSSVEINVYFGQQDNSSSISSGGMFGSDSIGSRKYEGEKVNSSER